MMLRVGKVLEVIGLSCVVALLAMVVAGSIHRWFGKTPTQHADTNFAVPTATHVVPQPMTEPTRERPDAPAGSNLSPMEGLHAAIRKDRPELSHLIDAEETVGYRVLVSSNCGLFYNYSHQPTICLGRTFCLADPTGNNVRHANHDAGVIFDLFRNTCSAFPALPSSEPPNEALCRTSFPINVLSNGNAEQGIAGWMSVSADPAIVEGTGNGDDPYFSMLASRGGVTLKQAVQVGTIPPRPRYALAIAHVKSSEERSTASNGQPTLMIHAIAGDESARGHSVKDGPASSERKGWSTLSLFFPISADTASINVLLTQSGASRGMGKPAKAFFDDVGLYYVNSEAEANCIVQRYSKSAFVTLVDESKADKWWKGPPRSLPSRPKTL